MKKVTIKKENGTGILKKENDGRWSIEINGKSSANNYYTQDQVEKIIATEKNNGTEILIED